MAYADSIRSATATMEAVATLIEGIFSSGYGLTFSSYAQSATQSGGGSLTYTSYTSEYSKYIQVGKLVIWIFRGYGTTGGTGNAELKLYLPVTAASVNGICGGGWTTDGSTAYAAQIAGASTTLLSMKRYDSTAYTLGASRYSAGIVIYEAA